MIVITILKDALVVDWVRIFHLDSTVWTLGAHWDH